MLSAQVVCCKYLLALLRNICTDADSVDRGRTAPTGADQDLLSFRRENISTEVKADGICCHCRFKGYFQQCCMCDQQRL